MGKAGARHSLGVAALILITDIAFKVPLLFQMINAIALKCLHPSQSEEKGLLVNILQIKSLHVSIFFFVHFE